MLEKQNFLLKAYFKKLISNYCLEDKNQISKFKFSELIELPLVISDRFWNIIISKTKAENNFKIEEYSHEIEKLPKNILVNNLISIYISIFNHDSDFLFEFLDIDENNVLIKSGVKFIYRNIYVHKYKTINGFEEKIYSEINKSFNNTKIILKKELNEKFSSSLIEFLFDFLINLKLFKNFETIKTLCDITVDDINYKNNLIYLKLIEENHFDIENNYFADKRDDENEYNNNIQNITQETLDISENGEYNNLSYKSYYNKQRKVSLSFKNINISSQVLKENILDKKIKKESFQIEKPEQYHLIGSEEEKINQKYIEHNYSLFNKNFFCLINQYYYTYKFFIHNGYIFYFKLSPKNNLFIFDGVILISNTHLKKKFEKIEDTNPPLYKSSIISHVCFENLNTDIYTYNTTDFIEFSDELMKYSRYKRFKDNYETIKEIGRGSFSIVYLVKNILDNKLYAVKKIDKDNILDDYKYYSMEYWEKNIFDYIKNVPNNNIVKSIEYFENSDYIFFIYEYLPDGMITKYNKDIIKGVYNGLLYLYKNGIIHRDIKAKNIIMKNNTPFIIDFGLSKMQSKINLCYESYGTLEYLAPEVLEGKGYNHKCDVWSFGVMLHTLKYGRVPFYSDKPDNDDNYKEEIINKIFGEEYIKKEDTDYDKLIETCLVKSNIDRNKISQIKRWINRFS